MLEREQHLIETGFILLKPDGVSSGVIADVAGELTKHHLQIEGVSVLRISRDDVSELYKGVFEKRGKDFFEQTLDYVSGGLSILILVSGENTLSKLKEIKGKTWQSGLRLKYAQNFVHNTFHTPDTKEDLQREMEVLLKKF